VVGDKAPSRMVINQAGVPRSDPDASGKLAGICQSHAAVFRPAG